MTSTHHHHWASSHIMLCLHLWFDQSTSCCMHFSVSVSTPWARARYIRLLLFCFFFHLRQYWRNLGSFCTLCFFKPAVPPGVFVEVGQKADHIRYCIRCRCSCTHFDSSQWTQVRLITLTTAVFCPSNLWQWVSESAHATPGPRNWRR